MINKRTSSTVILRIDRGEKIVESVLACCKDMNIKAAMINGIGASDHITCGVYSVENKSYKELDFKGEFEILSLSGNVTEMNGQPYVHIHITAADDEGKCFGGHLKEAVISATCEIFINLIDAGVSRSHDAESGLNLITF